MLKRRASGLLLHISSLPSPFGIGDTGPTAYRFADFLAGAHQRYWQILPLNPTSTGHDNSPYKSTSAFALNPLFISPELLVSGGLCEERDLDGAPSFPEGTVDYPAVERFKEALFDTAVTRFRAGRGDHDAYAAFCRKNEWWLSGFALFTSLHRRYQDRPWNQWPDDMRLREPDAILSAQEDLAQACEREQILQFLVQVQWDALHAYCMQRGIRIIGDMPIYVDYDSADVWMNPGLFRLDGDKNPVAVAGVPPDYFSRTGQLWNNPLYDWEAHRADNFSWWLMRLERSLALTDLVRIDHFRGLVAYWEVPAGAKDASNGRWVRAPATEFLSSVKARFPAMPVIAEDLGIITPDVRGIMKQFCLPGMRVLLFTFTEDPANNPNAPHAIPEDVVLYTGTHDNAPSRGWYETGATEAERQRVREYLGDDASGESLPSLLIRLAMISPATTTIIPVQDLLGLGIGARMNTPGTPEGNWRWRLSGTGMGDAIRDRLATMTHVYGRENGACGF